MRFILSLALIFTVAPAVTEAGWGVRRPDGTFRAWACCAPDETLRPGETYVELAIMPAIGPDAATLALPKPASTASRLDAIIMDSTLRDLLKEKLTP